MGYCNWGNASAVTLKYHDEEWGLPVRDDRRQFEYLMFYGPVTVYSLLQACGIINDHGRDCPRYAVVNAATQTIPDVPRVPAASVWPSVRKLVQDALPGF